MPIIRCYKNEKHVRQAGSSIERSTFLIDPQGILIREWRKVKVKNHIEEVLDALTSEVTKNSHISG